MYVTIKYFELVHLAAGLKYVRPSTVDESIVSLHVRDGCAQEIGEHNVPTSKNDKTRNPFYRGY